MANFENIINSCVREMQAMSFIVSSISILLALLIYYFTQNGYISLMLPITVNGIFLMIFTNQVQKNMRKKFHVS